MSSESINVASLIAAMQAGEAKPELVDLARSRFSDVSVLAEACDALLRGLSNEEYDFFANLDSQGLADEDVAVLAWFLESNTSCSVMRYVHGCGAGEEGRVRLLGAAATLRSLEGPAAVSGATS